MRLAVPLEIDPAAFATWRRDCPIVELGGETMGTSWRVKIAAPPGFDRAEVLASIETRLEAVLAQMSHWRADSLLGRFNRADAGEWFTLPTAFAHVMTAALDVAERSAGAFDPAIGVLVDIWGHGPVTIERLPTLGEVEAARGVSGYRRLAFDSETGRLRQPGGLRLDLSGIAKGFAVDALADLLRARGCDHALIEIGGELVGRGLRPDGDPWWVDLETPAAGIAGKIAPLRVALHQLAVATSGDYVRGRHTIDPRNGLPVEHAASVSVIHGSAMLADAWATALSVQAPDEMQALATREGLAVRALTRKDDALREWISPALACLLSAEDAPLATA
ncbi:thiamine biosynthesis lipoprotein [Novosphingobium sp. Rr 2-17]|uniref:FAD:protein FMN transferase n=1 Tax=Novosphingobium sp. Rr 2-17 TaxID=555793 RepID=UPI0002698E76|nr:FAD:protein FMN transferase [Novosphingobium sp. Rr 2-17]EIZ80946.1 thiamine biosynthesis lipoprotein [Novosphingobium sp. Rr 2-17]